MPIDDPNSENAPVAQNSMPNHGADNGLQALPFDLQEAGVVRQSRLPVQGRVREHRGEADGDDADRREGPRLLDVGEAPPAPPPHHVLGGGLEGVGPDLARRRDLFAGDGADEPWHVLPHPEALVADPVALAEVLAAAGAGERGRAQQQRKPELIGYGSDARSPR